MPYVESDPLVEEVLQIHFQPIVSLRQKAVVGLEALVRHRPEDRTAVVSVPELFRLARSKGRQQEFDRLLRRMAMESYRTLDLPGNPRPLLFVNFEASLLDGGLGSGAMLQAAHDAGLLPRDIVIEINESQIGDAGSLRRFVDFHRSHGFLIALDDFGAGHGNLPRVAELKPDILTVDRALIQGIDRDYYRQEALKSLVSLGARTGCLVLAEGVETEAEVDCCASLGAGLFQGWYFARPKPPADVRLESLPSSLEAAAQRLKESGVRSVQARRGTAEHLRRVSAAVHDALRLARPEGYDAILERLVRDEAVVECAYLIGPDGLQITATHAGADLSAGGNRLFHPAPVGTDHGAKDYFFMLSAAGLDRYTTDPYLSLATGRSCRTLACKVARGDGSSLVLCLDFP